MHGLLDGGKVSLKCEDGFINTANKPKVMAECMCENHSCVLVEDVKFR
jgi:hypothetical protein